MKYTTFRALLLAAGGVAALGGGLLLARGCTSGEGAATNDPAPAGQTQAGAQPPPGAPTQPMRPMDQAILDRVHKGISGDKVKDAFPGQPYKVNLYAEGGTAVNRVKIDLDRDEKWDEKWTLSTEDGKEQVKRQISPNDDDAYSIEYRLRAGAWALKQ